MARASRRSRLPHECLVLRRAHPADDAVAVGEAAEAGDGFIVVGVRIPRRRAPIRQDARPSESLMHSGNGPKQRISVKGCGDDCQSNQMHAIPPG